VSTGTDARLAVDFDEKETIAAFKLRLASIAGTAAEQQILVHAAKELQDDRTLGDYCITEGSVVHLTVRLRGGMRDNARSFPPPSFMVRNLTDTTVRKLYMREFTSRLNKNVVQFELFSLVGPVPRSSSSLGIPFNSIVRAFSGPSLLQLHRKTYERLANGVEGYAHCPVSLFPCFPTHLFSYFAITLFPYFPISLFPYFSISLFPYFPISLFPYFPISLLTYFLYTSTGYPAHTVTEHLVFALLKAKPTAITSTMKFAMRYVGSAQGHVLAPYPARVCLVLGIIAATA
jgi:hypothetical protein